MFSQILAPESVSKTLDRGFVRDILRVVFHDCPPLDVPADILINSLPASFQFPDRHWPLAGGFQVLKEVIFEIFPIVVFVSGLPIQPVARCSRELQLYVLHGCDLVTPLEPHCY